MTWKDSMGRFYGSSLGGPSFKISKGDAPVQTVVPGAMLGQCWGDAPAQTVVPGSKPSSLGQCWGDAPVQTVVPGSKPSSLDYDSWVSRSFQG